MPHAKTQRPPQLQSCIEECIDCHAICLETIQHCLQMGGKHADPHQIRALMSCADACSVSADAMLSGSEIHPRACGYCAEACDACEQSCLRIDPNDAHMKACAEACRRTADACRQMSGHKSAAA